MADHPREVALRGGWLLTRSDMSSVACRLVDGTSLILDGELHKDLWGDGRLIRCLGGVSAEWQDLSKAMEVSVGSTELGALIRGDSWGRLFVELTGRCNERCVHCYASSSPDVETALSWEEVSEVLTDARELGFKRVQFTGGDPLISPLIFDAVRRASSLGFSQIEVYTNGLAFREEHARLFRELGVDIAFSLYSHEADVHDRVTQTSGSHERTCRAVQLALGYGLEVRVAGIQGCDAAQDAERLRAFLIELGVSRARISGDRQRPVGRGSWEDGGAEQGTPVHAGDEPTAALQGKLCVTYGGDIVPCIFDRATILGNVRDMALHQVLSQPIGADSSKKSRALNVVGESLGCSDCRLRRDLLQSVSWTS